MEREKKGQGTTIEMPNESDWTLENAQARELLRTAHRDLDAAVRLIEETAEDPAKVPKTINKSIFKPLSQADPSAALAFAAQHPFWRDVGSQYLLQYVPFGRYESLVDELLTFPEPELGMVQLRAIMNWWAKGDPRAARQWADEHLSPKIEGHADVLLSLASDLNDLPEDLPTILENSSDRMRQGWFSSHARDIANHASADIPAKAAELIALAPEERRSGISTSLAFSWSQTAPEDAVEWLLQIDDPKTRRDGLASAASSWFGYLPFRAYKWLENASPETQEEVRAAVATRGLKLK